jgi:hypothetical protein
MSTNPSIYVEQNRQVWGHHEGPMPQEDFEKRAMSIEPADLANEAWVAMLSVVNYPTPLAIPLSYSFCRGMDSNKICERVQDLISALAVIPNLKVIAVSCDGHPSNVSALGKLRGVLAFPDYDHLAKVFRNALLRPFNKYKRIPRVPVSYDRVELSTQLILDIYENADGLSAVLEKEALNPRDRMSSYYMENLTSPQVQEQLSSHADPGLKLLSRWLHSIRLFWDAFNYSEIDYIVCLKITVQHKIIGVVSMSLLSSLIDNRAPAH